MAALFFANIVLLAHTTMMLLDADFKAWKSKFKIFQTKHEPSRKNMSEFKDSAVYNANHKNE